jgi:hypothetical protein
MPLSFLHQPFEATALCDLRVPLEAALRMLPTDTFF